MGTIFGILKLVRFLVLASEAHIGHKNKQLKKFGKYAHDGAAISALYHWNQYTVQGCDCHLTG